MSDERIPCRSCGDVVPADCETSPSCRAEDVRDDHDVLDLLGWLFFAGSFVLSVWFAFEYGSTWREVC